MNWCLIDCLSLKISFFSSFLIFFCEFSFLYGGFFSLFVVVVAVLLRLGLFGRWFHFLLLYRLDCRLWNRWILLWLLLHHRLPLLLRLRLCLDWFLCRWLLWLVVFRRLLRHRLLLWLLLNVLLLVLLFFRFKSSLPRLFLVVFFVCFDFLLVLLLLLGLARLPRCFLIDWSESSYIFCFFYLKIMEF